jgi:hypothetical protein
MGSPEHKDQIGSVAWDKNWGSIKACSQVQCTI